MKLSRFVQEVFPPLLTPEQDSLSFEDRRDKLLKKRREGLEKSREYILSRHRLGEGGALVVDALTLVTDALLVRLFHDVSAGVADPDNYPIALVALGGYGRRELNPFSDIDLMFLYQGKSRDLAEKIANRMLYLMWDMNLDVGYSVRTQEDCLEFADKDSTVHTALLDSRFLIGDESLYHHYEKAVLDVLRARNTQVFIRNKISEIQTRHQKFGSSVYLLEPNLKEGKGGLRELHTALWVAKVKFKVNSLQELVLKGVITEREKEEWEAAFSYLWRIRNELHFQSQRKNDQIRFNHQEKIARFLGYKDNRKALAVEQFMQDYYTHATHVMDLASSLIGKAANLAEAPRAFLSMSRKRKIDDVFYVLRQELRTSRQDAFGEDPSLLMKVFWLSQRHNVELSFQLQQIVREHAHLINDKVRRNPEINKMFMEILRYPKRVAETLRSMHGLHFLNHFLPEFARIFCRVQHDVYHTYTVDIHSLFAVEEFIKLWQGDYQEKYPILSRVAQEIEKRELLLLAILFHDVGKGEGGNHSGIGAEMTRTASRRLGLGKEDSQRLEFLVRHHLEMAHIAQRRDLSDDRLIIEFARLMGMSENLRMLYLLTFADLMAVGPEVMTPWKAYLLGELYEKSFLILEKGEFALEKRSEKVRKRKKKIAEILSEDYGERRIKDELKHLDTRYVLSYSAREISEHLRVLFNRGEKTLAMQVDPEPEADCSRVIVSTLDYPGLFSNVAGVLAAAGINILSAQIYTFKNGVAVDILRANSNRGKIVDDEEKWHKVEKALTGVIEGRLQVHELVRKRKREPLYPAAHKPRFSARVEIDNEVSQKYTVIDLFTDDRIGLLYDITRTLAILNLTIGVSKISTKGDQVADTFYVQDIFGDKITQPAKIEELRRELLGVLQGENGGK